MHDELKTVSRFEANLLHILHFLLRRDPTGQALRYIFDEMTAPPCLSRNAVELVQDTLVKGCVSILARASGWWKEKHLKQGQIVEGRLWERYAAEELALRFSEHTLRFLLWITAKNPKSNKTRWLSIPLDRLTWGDLLFFYIAFGMLRQTEAATFFSSRDLFTTHGLCRLAHADAFTETPPDKAVEFARWTTGVGAGILEALQQELTDAWLRMERGKSQIQTWQHMQALGRSQEIALQTFGDALEQTERWDLGRFLFPVLKSLLPENPQMEWWTGGLSSSGPRLQDRTETHRAALVLLRSTGRLQKWNQQARGVAFFDDNYQASQLYKSDWEQWQGETLRARALSLLQQIEPL